MPIAVKRLLLDILKPRELSIIELSKALCSVKGVEDVDITVTEVDSQTETIKVTIKGSHIETDALKAVIEKYGVSMKGMDEISVTRI